MPNSNVCRRILLLKPSLLLFFWFLAGTFLNAAPPEPDIPGNMGRERETFPIEGAISVFAENSYVTEGINNVPGSSFVFADLELYWRDVSAGVWWAEALSDSYDEVNFYADYAFDVGPVGFLAGINHLRFPHGGESSTSEVYGGIEGVITDHLFWFLFGYYDVDAVNGGFFELGLNGVIPVVEGRLSLNPYTFLGLDYGYVSRPRNLRENNWQVGVEIPWKITESLTVFGLLHHSFALSNLSREGLGDETWGGGGVSWSF